MGENIEDRIVDFLEKSEDGKVSFSQIRRNVDTDKELLKQKLKSLIKEKKN